jgi:hypothetical protein
MIYLPLGLEELPGTIQEVLIPHPEIDGGQIVLIARNNNAVQRPPQNLDRMHASLSKQIAFNRRIMKTEDEISGINSDLANFVQNLSPDPRNLSRRPFNARIPTDRRTIVATRRFAKGEHEPNPV